MKNHFNVEKKEDGHGYLITLRDNTSMEATAQDLRDLCDWCLRFMSQIESEAKLEESKQANKE